MIVPMHATARVHAHTATSSGNGTNGELPAIATGFVRKLYRILDQESGAVISWTRSGTAFDIYDDERLNELILPRYFRGRLCAFRQQLREHGFQQLLPSGASAPIAPVAPLHQPQQCTYAHEHFVRGSPERLCKIVRTPLPRRRLSNRKSKAAASAKRTAAAAAASAKRTAAAAAADIGNSTKRARTTASPASSSSSSFTSSSSASTSHLAPVVTSQPNPNPLLPLPQQPLPMSSHPLQVQLGGQLMPTNPLFSTERDATVGDWLSLDDVALDSGGPGPDVTADVAFSDDMLGALMTLMSNSMTTVSPTSTCGSSSAAAATTTTSYAAKLTPATLAMKVSATAVPTVYETHQFSDDTINSMMLWLGTGHST